MSETAAVPHILVVDDDTEVRYSLNRVLSSQHYKVSESPSGEEGVAAVKRQPPDVVLLDNRMTGMSGLETLQHIRAANPKQLVILMTADLLLLGFKGLRLALPIDSPLNAMRLAPSVCERNEGDPPRRLPFLLRRLLLFVVHFLLSLVVTLLSI